MPQTLRGLGISVGTPLHFLGMYPRRNLRVTPGRAVDNLTVIHRFVRPTLKPVNEWGQRRENKTLSHLPKQTFVHNPQPPPPLHLLR